MKSNIIEFHLTPFHFPNIQKEIKSILFDKMSESMERSEEAKMKKMKSEIHHCFIHFSTS